MILTLPLQYQSAFFTAVTVAVVAGLVAAGVYWWGRWRERRYRR